MVIHRLLVGRVESLTTDLEDLGSDLLEALAASEVPDAGGKAARS
jgi:hypothetical protein